MKKHKNHPGTIKKQTVTMKNHKIPPGTMKNHETLTCNHKNNQSPPGTKEKP